MQYFKNVNTNTLKDRHREELTEMSIEYREYLQQALEYAIAHGFNQTYLPLKGECIAKQG